MEKVLILLVIMTTEFVDSQTYTQEEYEAYLNWKYEFGNTGFFRGPQQQTSEMETIINDFRKITEHNERFEAGTESFSQQLWKKSNLAEEKRHVLKSGFSIIDVQKVLNPQSSTPGTFQKNPVYNLFTTKPPTFPVAPASLDWRDYNVVMPVQDQGYECSSCWAFSAVGAIEGAYTIATGKSVKLSEQQLIDCNYNWITGNWGCWVRSFK
jgi:C1A family cysteine protease